MRSLQQYIKFRREVAHATVVSLTSGAHHLFLTNPDEVARRSSASNRPEEPVMHWGSGVNVKASAAPLTQAHKGYGVAKRHYSDSAKHAALSASTRH